MTTRQVDRPRTAAAAPTGTSAGHGTGWVRATAVGGLVSFGLLMAFGTLTSDSPAAGDPPREVVAYLTQHHDRLQLAAALYGLAMPAALLFLAGLFAALRRAEGGRPRLAVAALAGGGLAAAATVTGALVLGTVATRYVTLGAGTASALWTMFLLSIGATLTGQLLMIGVTAAVGWRGGMFARWFLVASALLAVLSVAGAFTIGFTATGIQVLAGVTVLLDAVWILVVSLYLLRRPELACD